MEVLTKVYPTIQYYFQAILSWGDGTFQEWMSYLFKAILNFEGNYFILITRRRLNKREYIATSLFYRKVYTVQALI
jgi:hypothetical protein